jgi:photosystem II stability/assembly factor-like uncharacterized protein
MKKSILFASLIPVLLFSCKKDNENDHDLEKKLIVWDTVYTGSGFDFREEYFAIDNNTGGLAVNTPTTVKILMTIDGGKKITETDTKLTTLEVRSVAFQTKDVGYISLFNQGVLRTEDGGKNWTKIYDGAGGLTANNNSFTIIDGSKVLYSTDKGATFIEQTVDFGLFQNPGSSFRFANEVYFWFFEGLLKSADGGKTWENANVTFSSISSMTAISSTKWYLTSREKLFLTEDKGINWRQVDNENYYYISAAKSDTLFINRGKNINWTKDGVTFKVDDEVTKNINMFAIGTNLIGFNNDRIFRRKI